MLLLKVCGMRDKHNISQLLSLNPDFIGFIFHKKSPRNVTEYFNVPTPNNTNKVGVFVDESLSFIKEKAQGFNLNFIQLHGFESPVLCEKIKTELKLSVIKAFNIYDGFDFNVLAKYEPYCNYFLFDAFGKNAGGNGVTFNWETLQHYKGSTPFLLSGGIDLEHTKKIKKIKHPQFVGVDINSKFETAFAYKNIEKIKQFKNELSSK